MEKMIDKHYTDIAESLKVLHGTVLNNDEKDVLHNEIKSLSFMIRKLEEGRVEIAVFGEVSSGKSALLNALLGNAEFEVGARCGVTRGKEKREWKTMDYKMSGFDNSCVLLVDTPGINEVDGKAREEIAREIVKDADIILFVVTKDLTEIEFQALQELHALHKPIIVTLTKTDTLNQQQKQVTIQAINDKLDGIVKNENIIEVAGNPNPVKVIIRKADGSEVDGERKMPPIIEELQIRILNILDAEGKAIVALNAAMFSANISDRVATQKIKLRKKYVDSVIMKYSMLKGVAVAVNPIPLVDAFGGVCVDTYMFFTIGKIYGIKQTLANVQELGVEISKALGAYALIEIGAYAVSAAAKGLTFGAATLFIGVPQAMVASYASYIVGHASHQYYANGASWGKKGAKTVVKEIMSTINKDSVMAELKNGIRMMLKDKKKIMENIKNLKEENQTPKEGKSTLSESIKNQLNESISQLSGVTCFADIKEIFKSSKG